MLKCQSSIKSIIQVRVLRFVVQNYGLTEMTKNDSILNSKVYKIKNTIFETKLER